MNKEIKSLFKRLGLQDREILVYVSCLQTRQGLFIHQIVKQSKLPRNSVYLIVQRLLQKEFLNKVKVGRRLRYFASPPKTLLLRQKQLVEDLEQAELLLAKLNDQKRDMDVVYFEGVEGLRRVHNDILLETKFAEGPKKHVLGFSSGADTIKLYPNIQKTYIDKRIRNGVCFKAIVPRNSQAVREWSKDPKALRDVKYMPRDKNLFRMETQIYADNVMLYSTTPPIGGVVIRNEAIADSMRALFELVWELLPE